jgi:hypothetical protein
MPIARFCASMPDDPKKRFCLPLVIQAGDKTVRSFTDAATNVRFIGCKRTGSARTDRHDRDLKQFEAVSASNITVSLSFRQSGFASGKG